MSRTILKTSIIFLTGIQIITSEYNHQDLPCQLRKFALDHLVCVCNFTYCDTIQPVKKVNPPNVLVYTSNMAGLRFKKTQSKFEPVNGYISNAIFIFEKEYQKMYGFGGAFTDATGINIKSLSFEAQNYIMRSFFSKEGLEYTLGRVPIGCSDYSLRPYTYDDTPFEDPDLEHFKLANEDYLYKIPFIQEAKRLSGNQLKLMGVAWTSPKWMKILPFYSVMFGRLKKSMFQPWANYHIKFLEEYEKNNLTFWSLSTGNEPSVGYTPLPIPTVAFTPTSLSKWIANHLGPTLRNSKFSDVKILTLDDQRTLLPNFIKIMFQNPETKKYVDGIGTHFYLDFFTPDYFLEATHSLYPDKFLIVTEASRGLAIFLEEGVVLGSWQRGEEIAAFMMENFKHWSTGWMTWNLVLNEAGGPSYILNKVDAPIIVNATAGEFYKQPSFYVHGHFSKFVSPGSVRIDVSKCSDHVFSIGFKRPDGGIVVIILNTMNEYFDALVIHKVKGKITLKLTPRSITSVVFW